MAQNVTEFQWTTTRERAAQLVADDVLSDEHIASQLGLNRRTLARWKLQPAFKQRVEEHLTAARELIRAEGIANRQNRVDALSDRWNRLHQVIAARAEDLQAVPGGSTGLLVRQLKSIGVGENNQVVEEYIVDTGLLAELRNHERQAAQELGQWTEKRELLGAEGGEIQVKVIDYRDGLGPLKPPDADDES